MFEMLDVIDIFTLLTLHTCLGPLVVIKEEQRITHVQPWRGITMPGSVAMQPKPRLLGPNVRGTKACSVPWGSSPITMGQMRLLYHLGLICLQFALLI